MNIRNILEKIIIIAIILLLFSNSLFAESSLGNKSGGVSYELYDYNEFPEWMHKVRRAESLFLGSLPLTFGAVILTANLFMVNSSGNLTHDDYLFRIGIAAAVSLGIALIDYILGELPNE